MDKRLQPGDLALIIKSVTGASVGKIITCIEIAGTHSKYGVVWLVEAPTELMTENGKRSKTGHMPQDWLMKIPKDTLPGEADESHLPLETVV